MLAIVVGNAVTARGGPARATATATAATVRWRVGPTRLLSPDFGYTVAYKWVAHGATTQATTGLFVYDHGRWRNVTPPTLNAGLISAVDDVAFTDPQHGWVAAYDCAQASVYLYRTSDGGHSWQSLGAPGAHSCGGGPTFLSFVDTTHGWMEPVSPNGPVGDLLRTVDGGVTWSLVASLHDEKPGLPCLAPIAFVSRSTGWMGESTPDFHDYAGRLCGARVYASRDAGRTWTASTIRLPRSLGMPNFDVPRFFGQFGVVSATVGAETARTVAFAVSRNNGSRWSVRSIRRISSCAPRGVSWPTSVAGARVWWIVAGRLQQTVQTTRDGGRHWHTVVAKGLPARRCAVLSLSAANTRIAWAVARYGSGDSTALFQTRDGGSTWRHVRLLVR
jgi:photosystem II stability/assembly factor-like uncharacterized protein